MLGTFSLASVTSYLNTDSSANAAYGYAFTYSDSLFRTCTDPISQLSGYCAGEHLLTKITPSIYQSGTAHALQPTTFSYSPAFGQSGALVDTYYDSSQSFTTTTSWQYLAAYQDLNTGIGDTAITYALAYSNSDGTPTIKSGSTITDDRYDALYCSTNANNPDTSLRCTGIYGHPDDHAWSVQVVTSLTSSGKDSSSLSPATTTYVYYRLANTYPYTHQSGSIWCQPDQNSQEQDCVGDNWFASGDSDWGDYYHAEFRGFNQVWRHAPAGDLTVDFYFSTEGWNEPATDPADYDGGQLLEEDRYQGATYSTSTLVQKTVTTYPGPYAHTVPSNSTSNPTACYTPSGSSPYAACDVMPLSSVTTDYEQTNSSSAPWVEHDYSYDDYDTTNGLKSGFHNLTQEVTKGANLPSALYPLTEKWSYATNTSTPSGWTYYTVDPVSHSEVDDNSGHIWQCQYTKYDEGNTNPTPSAGWPTTVNTYSSANCAAQAILLTTVYTNYDAYGNVVATVDGVGAATPALYNTQGCTVASGTIEIASSAWTQGRYTTCASYDTSHYEALPVSTTNAFSQSTSYTYDATQGNVLSQSQDPNSQTTSYTYSYDTSGNSTVQVTQPPDTSHYTTQANSYTTCPNSSNGLPCYEVDKLSYLYNTVLASTFYDSLGRAVETSTPGPAPSNPTAGKAYYTIAFTYYNDANHSTYQSEPFVVAVPNTQHGSGYIDPNGATDYLGNTPGGTATYDDALGRALAVRDPLYGSSGEPGIACSSILSGNYTACTNYGLGSVSGDSNTYQKVSSIDANNHVTHSYADALGRTVYVSYKSGLNSGTLTTNELKSLQYNVLNEPTQVMVTDKAPQSGQTITSVTTSAQYDDLGRLTQVADPDRGTHNYTYDGDGRVFVDASGTRTIGYVYDLLGRLGCVQDAYPSFSPTGACTSGANPYVQNTYDTSQLTVSGTADYPVGRLTQSVATTHFPDGSTVAVTQPVEHDARGRVIAEQLQFGPFPASWNVTHALPTYQAQDTYNDADQLQTTTTSTIPTGQGFTTTQVYDSTTGVETGLSNNGTATANLATLSYSSQAQLSSINFLTSTGGALSTDAFGYDGNLRPISTSATWQGGSGNPSGSTIFSENSTFDVASNLVSLATTQAAVPGSSGSGGSETQNFCYDEQNRLVWAGNSGTQPGAGNGTCGSGTLSNSLSGASYSNSYVYTHLGELWQGPLAGGSTQEQYLSCASNTHQLVGLYPTTSGATCSNYTTKTADYSSSYDSWGNVTGRTFSGTSATLSYDLLDHLTKWLVSSSNKELYVYDASGQRVLRRTTNGSGTTMIVYAFGLEEHSYGGAGAHQSDTYYYSLGGRLLGALDSNGTTFYMTDALGSVLASFSNVANSAAVKGNQVFGPYGNAPYSKGTINTTKGFTGQYNDGLTGLDYYGSRYYDPVVGVFLSADSKQGNMQGMNPYAYVNGNPETHSDPSGRYVVGPNGETFYPGSTYYTYQGVKYPLNQAPPIPKPSPCGAGTHMAGGICVANILTCGAGTVQEGSTCVTEANSKAGQVRDNRLTGLRRWSVVKQIAGYILFLVGDFMLFSSAHDLANKLQALVDIGVTLVTNILPLAGEFFSATVPHGIYTFSKWVMWALGGLESIITGIKQHNWWVSEGSQLAGQVIANAAGGPIGVGVQLLLTFIRPMAGNLLDIGGHALLGWGLGDYAEYQRQEDMPIRAWCAQYGGCPAVL